MTQSGNLRTTLATEELQSGPRQYRIQATDADLSDLAERFKIVSISKLEAAIKVQERTDPQAVVIEGELAAELVQQCVVTLRDVPETIGEAFELWLVAPDIADAFDEDEKYADPDAPDYDAFEGDKVPLGEIIAQTLSVMMNPYPRVPGAEVKPVAGQGVTVNEELEQRPNPFGVLAQMRDKS